MLFTRSHHTARIPFRRNPLLKTLAYLLIGFWAYTGIMTTNLPNWILENSLTMSAFILLISFYRHYRFSDLSYCCFFLFLLLHLYGSQYSYAETPLGNWFQETFSTSRNHYDRLVHFSFGFLLAYPMRELVQNVLRFRSVAGFLLPVEWTVSLSALYELAEWAVADVFFPEASAAYLGMQGDIWDTQKDIFMATTGASLSMLLLYLVLKASKKTGRT